MAGPTKRKVAKSPSAASPKKPTSSAGPTAPAAARPAAASSGFTIGNILRYGVAAALPCFYLYRAYLGYNAVPPAASPSARSSASSPRAQPQQVLHSESFESDTRSSIVPAITPEEVLERRESIRHAFKTSWNAYERDAWGFDNYHPISQAGTNLESKGIGYFIVDAIDSLQIFGLQEEYERAREWVATELSFDVDDKHHAFETTIRVLGGLLSAYHFSENDKLFLDKAVDLADRLLPIFDTPSGIPLSFINLDKRQGISDKDNRDLASVAEAGTLQLEFKYLSHLTGNPIYWEKVENVMTLIKKNPKNSGLVPLFLNPQSGRFELSEIRLGSRADSYYEYLLKQYLQTNRSEQIYRDMYNEAMAGIRDHLVMLSPLDNKTAYTVELVPGQNPQNRKIGFHRVPKQDHLVCFLGGLLMLGVTEGPAISESLQPTVEDQRNWLLGEELIKTCVDTYKQSQTGLGAEIVFYYRTPEEKVRKMDDTTRTWYIDKRKTQRPGQPKPDPPIDARNILRPETVESLFVGWRLTHNPKYRQWGWEIFQAFEKHCKIATGGYASIRDVDEVPAVHEDRMETFFLSETLKYLYLLYAEDDVVPLNKYVYNTEAHPLPIFTPDK